MTENKDLVHKIMNMTTLAQVYMHKDFLIVSFCLLPASF